MPYFYGMASPASAMLIISAAGLIWLQPSSGYGPNLTEWNCGICFGEGEKPYLDFIILPVLLISGGLMISDRKMSKLKSGVPMKLSVVQLTVLLFAIIIAGLAPLRTPAESAVQYGTQIDQQHNRKQE